MTEHSYSEHYDALGEYQSESMQQSSAPKATTDLRKALKDSLAMTERPDVDFSTGIQPSTLKELEAAHERENNGGLIGDRGPASIPRHKEALRLMMSGLRANANNSYAALLTLRPEDRPAFKGELYDLHFACGQVMKAINLIYGHLDEPPYLTLEGALLK